MISTQTIRGFILLFVFILISTSAIAQNKSTTEPDTANVIDRLIMERVMVVGQPVWKSSIPGAANYISAEQLQRQNYSDINRILRSVSGVNIQEEEGFGLRPNIGLRGAGSERSSKINIMEDGILAAPAPYSAPAAYYFPNMNRISSVEVRKGSSQIKYGPNTTGGALNLVSTPIPTEFSGRAMLGVGERSSNQIYANIGNRSERYGYLIEVTQAGDDGFKKLDSEGETGYTVRDILGKFMVQSSNNASVYQRLEFKAGYHTELSDETYLGLTRGDFANSPNKRYAASQVDQMDTEHIQLMARHFALFSDKIDLTTSIYRNDFSRAWYKLHDLNTDAPTVNTGSLSAILSNPGANTTEMGYLRGNTSPTDVFNVRNNNREYYSQGIESILGVNFDAGDAQNQLELGVRLHQDQEDRFQFEDGYGMVNGSMVQTSSGVPGTQANRVGSATALSVFLQDKIRLNDWTFTPGVRFENIWFNNKKYDGNDLDRTGTNLNETDYTVSILLPGLGVTYQATKEIAVIAGIHRGFSPPSPGSSSETTSEKSVNYELGFRYDTEFFQVEAIGFYNNYSNLLGSDLAAAGGGGTTAQFNAGAVDVTGLELTANVDLAVLFGVGSFSVPFNTNYTFTDATFGSSFDSGFKPWSEVEEGDKIPFIPQHQLNSYIGVENEKLSIGFNASYQPTMRTVAGSGSIPVQNSTDSYFILDLRISYNLSSNFELFVNVRNLLDETYIVSDRPFGVRPGLPRTVMGGIKVNL